MEPLMAVWMDLEGFMLSQKSPRKTNTIWFYLHTDSKKQKLLDTRGQIGALQMGGELGEKSERD